MSIVDLSNSGLTQIPARVLRDNRVEELNVSSNELTELPTNIDQLSSLASLDASNNALTRLPASIGRLANLVDLKLDHNRLTSLPEGFSQLINLEALNLASNDIRDIPCLLSLPPKLGFLSLADNPFIVKLPADARALIDKSEQAYRHYVADVFEDPEYGRGRDYDTLFESLTSERGLGNRADIVKLQQAIHKQCLARALVLFGQSSASGGFNLGLPGLHAVSQQFPRPQYRAPRFAEEE